VIGSVAAVVAIVLVVRLRRKPSPEEMERRRRQLIYEAGQLIDAEVIDVEGTVAVYSYGVAGVNYTVSQDLAPFEPLLPEDRMTLVGPALAKYVPRNPANSIVVCEHWNGLRLG